MGSTGIQWPPTPALGVNFIKPYGFVFAASKVSRTSIPRACEICANSFQSAKNAEEAGAHRIELCSELAVGGITPSYGLIKQVVEELSIETYVLIRPRSGNFTYTDVEIEIMKNDIQTCKDLGCSGIVSGVLKEDNSLDVKRTKMLLEISKPLAFTFHRAFDCVLNPMETLDSLVDLGVDRILTSGQESSVDDGLELLNQLKIKGGKNLLFLLISFHGIIRLQ